MAAIAITDLIVTLTAPEFEKVDGGPSQATSLLQIAMSIGRTFTSAANLTQSEVQDKGFVRCGY